MVNIFLNKQLQTGSHDTVTNYCVHTLYHQVAIYLYNGDTCMINLMFVELFFSTDSNLVWCTRGWDKNS
jgi:hypothetical protein